MAVENAADLLPAKIALIGALGIGAQWLAWRLQWPAIVLMSAAGLIIGPLAMILLGSPIVDPAADFGDLLRPMIALAVALILFEGGLDLHFSEIRGLGVAVRRMILVVAPVGWALGTLAAHYLAGLPWDIAALFGGLLVVTGPTVILPLLRQAKLAGRPAALLKWEGIVNDPVGAILAVFVYEAIRFTANGQTWVEAGFYLLWACLVGAALGVGFGWALAQAFKRGYIPEFLKAPMVLAAVLGCFVIADMVAHETGLLAVTAFGMMLGNSRVASIGDMRRFKETIAVVLVSGVFVLLTASLTPATLIAMDWRAFLFVGGMLFIVRPATVWLSTIGAGLSWQERTLVGWIAPRGIVAVAVAGFFANELVALGRTEAQALVPLVFLMVFATVILHGFTIRPLARLLGLSKEGPEGILIVGANPWSLGLAQEIRKLDIPVLIADTNWRRLRRARLDGLDTYFGEVLSEAADHRLDHSRFGWLIAATSNDAYNALVCVEFAPELGRHRVFQTASGELAEREEDKDIAFTARGQSLLSRARSFDALSTDWWRGWRFRTTRLTETYTLEQFRREREGVDIVLTRARDGKLALMGVEDKLRGEIGATILWFGPAKASVEKPGERPGEKPGEFGPEAPFGSSAKSPDH